MRTWNGEGEIPISHDDLASAAGRFFKRADIDDIPSKLWFDYWVGGKQIYLRATFERGVRNVTLVRMAGLAAALEEAHGYHIVPIAYERDMTWQEAEELNQRLNRVD